MSTPAERYAEFRAGQSTPVLADFRSLYDFGLDDFQVEACTALEKGHGVLVAAPTGSGKTLVGEFAIHLGRHQRRKCFYTTPIKALSNQKFADLVARYGPEEVGLLTGDNTVNGEAPIVVMTTEVLRNMIYAGSRTLADVGFVVMDEVHYLADRARGAVWEEVIIGLADSVSVVALSATVSNAEEFGRWLSTVRGDTAIIVEETRPVPLSQHVMVGRRMFDLFDSDPSEAAEPGRVNPELLRVARDDFRAKNVNDRRSPKARRGQGGRPQPRQGFQRGSLPNRADVIDRLDRDALLPAIYFIFSRAGCQAAVDQCLASNVRLTTPAERDEIVAFVENRCSHLPPDDLQVLGYHEFLDALSRGIAAHHAGMLPTFKEIVEDLFTEGRCRVVFATETLALGINMPARSVVLEKLVKWNGETHADITPGEYTQLTGRAGRRGIDTEGHGVVLWSNGLDPKTVAGMASTRTYPLRSSFRPSYNMAVNLVNQTGRERARHLLESSFAQFQADAAVVGLASQLRKAEQGLAGYAESARCHLGDFMEYSALRRELSDTEAAAARSRRHEQRDTVADALAELRHGDIIEVPRGKYSGFAVVLDPGVPPDRSEPRPYVLTIGKQARRLSLIDFDRPVSSLGRLKVPKSFNARNPTSRRDLAIALSHKATTLDPESPSRTRARTAQRVPEGTDQEISRVRNALRAHPCHNCNDRESHARWAERWHKLDRECEVLRRRIQTRTNTIARQFDRVCDVLGSLGYLIDDQVSEAGARLMRLYSESDLVAAECLRLGVWDGLDPAELAAALSVLVFETRRAEDATAPRVPAGAVRETIDEMTKVWRQLHRLERDHKVSYLDEPDVGFAYVAYRWANGAELDDVLRDSGLAAGDFVRWIKQLVDLTGQVSDAAGPGELRETARSAIAALRRGVVAYSSLSQ